MSDLWHRLATTLLPGDATELGQRFSARTPLWLGTIIAVVSLWLSAALPGWVALLGIAGVAVASGTVPLGPEHGGLSRTFGRGTDAEARAAEGAMWPAVVDAIPDPALVLDDDLTVLHANAPAREILPNLRDGRSLNQATRHPSVMAAIERARGGEKSTTAQLVETMPLERRITVVVSRVEHGPRRSPELLVVLRDTSEQDRLTQMRADFIANASHELRTPLASLRGFVETLQGPAKNDPAARQRFLGLMAAQAERMTRLIDDLLSLSRVEMRVHVPPRGEVDVAEAVRHVAQTLDPIAKSAKATLTTELPETPLKVRGERDEIVQILQNLGQNALKYGREGGHVVISVRKLPAEASPRERIAIAVSDDGPGIAPVHLPRLTERFYRVNTASSREKGGTGLGLAIVKHIVTRHRGEMKIESTVGKGSTFTVLFDAAG